jgi:hypothetical protein
LPNGVFWTMSIPERSFRVRRNGRVARLRVRDLPVPDTFFFANNVSVAAEIDVDITWRATADPVVRGKGTEVPPDDWAAFLGEFSDASCDGTAGGRETGFCFETGELSADGFFAEIGHERNGRCLTE